MDRARRRSSARSCCSSARSSSCRCCRPRSSTPARRRSSSSTSRRRPARARSAVRDRAAEAEAPHPADDEVELVQTTVPPEGDTGFRTLVSAQAGRAANSATMFVRLDSEADLEDAALRLEEALGAGRDRWLGRDRPAGHGPRRAATWRSWSAAPTSTRSSRRPRRSSRPSATSTGSRTSPATWSRRRRRSRSGSTPSVPPRPASAAAQVGGVVRGALTPIPVTTIQPEDADEPVARAPALRSRRRSTRSRRSAALPVGQGATLGDVADIEEQDVRATITPRQRDAVVDGERRDHRRGHRRHLGRGQGRARSAGGGRRAARRAYRSRSAASAEQQAEAFGGLFVAMGVAWRSST